ncbi:MAG: hypothetical protein KGN79_05040 [Acidobacteriota bacterium]|nr:hypothetical protein [Acidobacteriota bacterium]
MKFNVKALAVGCAIFWGAVVLLVAVSNLIWSGYGYSFLHAMASIYPGYRAVPTVEQVVLVTVFATADGLIGGAVFGLLYNWLTDRFAA